MLCLEITTRWPKSREASIGGKIAFGPNAGNYVTKIGSGFGYGEETPLAKGSRCCSLNGFSLHAIINQFIGKPTRPEGGDHRRRASGTLRMVDD